MLVYRTMYDGKSDTITCHVRGGSARCAGASRMPPGWTTAYDGRTGRFCGGVPGGPWLVLGPHELFAFLSLFPEDEDSVRPPAPPHPTGGHFNIAGVPCEEVVFPPQDDKDSWRKYCLAPSIRLAGVKNWVPLFRALGVRTQDLAAFADDRGVVASETRSQNGRVESAAVAIRVERTRLDPNRFDHLCDGLVY